jgi:small subunit ribosomal protein S1
MTTDHSETIDPSTPDILEQTATGGASERIKIGSQRGGVSTRIGEPVPVIAPPKVTQPTPLITSEAEKPIEKRPTAPPKHYPPPNIRDRLTPDLEMEYAEAIGDVQIDQMLSSDLRGFEAELEPETKVQGRVLTTQRDSVFLDLGGRKQGYVKLATFPEPPAEGSLVETIVSRFDAAEGLYELTLPGRAVDVGDWSQVAEGMIVEARVTGHNKGGLECEVNQLRGFIPASQISMYRVEDLAKIVGERFTCVITEANPEKRNLVLSRRAILEREKAEAKENLLASLEVGQTREGTVRSLQGFGAFVDLGGIDGLIHISQLSWERIRHASEVLEVGQRVKVKIQKIDPETGKIGLAFRDLAENPWERVTEKYPSRSRVKGTVSRLTEFGAFVKLEPGIEGLIHISELAHKRVIRASDIVSEGQDVEVLIMSVDAENQRIGLSLKALEGKPESKEESETEEETAPLPAQRGHWQNQWRRKVWPEVVVPHQRWVLASSSALTLRSPSDSMSADFAGFSAFAV